MDEHIEDTTMTKELSVLNIDRRNSFDSENFIGSRWTIGEQDKMALLLTEIDFSKVDFVSGLEKGESSITGVEKLSRLKQGGLIRLDAKVGQALYQQKGQSTLRFLYETRGISWMEFAGTVLVDVHEWLFFLRLRRKPVGWWHWNCYWLGNARRAVFVSPLLTIT